MIVTVSTVKDKLSNVERFVNANLASGADHMIVFLDAHDKDVERWLTDRPEVTLIVTDKTWWNGTRPQLLNKRQRANANLTKAVLSLTSWADWLFHVDADEVVQIDRAALAEVPAHEQVVKLRPLEVVSKMHWDGTPNLFKPLLGQPDLNLLFALGALTEPSNSLYFRSHINGKIGLRPQLDLVMRIHRATNRRGKPVPAVSGPGFRLLHYESFSGEEFVRKWTAMIGSGPSIHFGPHRMRLAAGMKSLLEKNLDADVTARYLTEVYHRHMEDPVDLLSDLGLLEEIDPLAGGHVPELLRDADKEHFRQLIEAVRPIDKRLFLAEVASPRKAAQALKSAVQASPVQRQPRGA